jgi:hypothetical protein
MLGGILIPLVAMMHVYVFWRADSVPTVKRHVPGWVPVGSGAVLCLVFFLGRYGHGSSGTAAGMRETAGMTWMTVLFLTTVSFFAAELVTGLGFLMPGRLPRFGAWP